MRVAACKRWVVRSNFLAIVFWIAGFAAAADVGDFQSQVLFTAGEQGYTTFRIPSITVTPRGTIMVAAAGRQNGWSDWTAINTVFRRSVDHGKTWEPLRKLNGDDKQVYDNATFITDGDRTFLMFQINYAKAYLRYSDDEGVTWSEPREITPVFETYRTRDNFDWQVIAMGPGHGIVLKGGRYIVPIWLSTSHSHRPSISSTIYSDDKGETWQAGDVVTQNLPESKNPSENVCVELADGRVMDNIRCESLARLRLVAYSPDGATRWTKPQADEHLFDPVCFASMARYSLPGDGNKNRILFCNPDSKSAGELGNKANMYFRRNVTVRLSYDEGQNWPVSKVVDPGDSGYSDIAVGPDGYIYLAWENGATNGEKAFSSKYLSVARFDLAWLTDGADRGK